MSYRPIGSLASRLLGLLPFIKRDALPPVAEYQLPRAAQQEVGQRETINVYCDESCHLENDKQRAMAVGAIWCPRTSVQRLSNNIRLIKRAHKLDPHLEIKWTKVSPGKLGFYQELLELFFSEPDLRFRALLIPDKSKLDHRSFNQTHDDFYYKMYYYMLRHIIEPSRAHHIYIDIKDTRGAKKVAKLQEVLCNTLYDTDRSVVARVQQIRSNESELLQLADLLLGAVAFANRGLSARSGKGQLVERVRRRPEVKSLDQTSPFGRTKFNLFVWTPQSGALE
jgi:Protein of unknown function (DUF3800)